MLVKRGLVLADCKTSRVVGTFQDKLLRQLVKVDVIETLGWECHVHFKYGEHQFLSVIEAQKLADIKEEQEVGLYVAPEVVHLFNHDEHGTAIAHGGGLKGESKSSNDADPHFTALNEVIASASDEVSDAN